MKLFARKSTKSDECTDTCAGWCPCDVQLEEDILNFEDDVYWLEDIQEEES